MEPQSSKKKPGSHVIEKLLFIIGRIVMAWGFLAVIALIFVAIMMSDSPVFSGASSYQTYAAVPNFLLVHVAVGAVCLGMGRVIQILEEIRTAA